MISKGDFIRHKRFLDVCLRVTNAFDYGHGLEIKASWWNMAFVNSYPIGHGYGKRINFKKDKDRESKALKQWVGDWEILRTPSPPACLRDGKWAEMEQYV